MPWQLLTCSRIQFVVRDGVGHGLAEAGSRKARS